MASRTETVHGDWEKHFTFFFIINFESSILNLYWHCWNTTRKRQNFQDEKLSQSSLDSFKSIRTEKKKGVKISPSTLFCTSFLVPYNLRKLLIFKKKMIQSITKQNHLENYPPPKKSYKKDLLNSIMSSKLQWLLKPLLFFDNFQSNLTLRWHQHGVTRNSMKPMYLVNPNNSSPNSCISSC